MPEFHEGYGDDGRHHIQVPQPREEPPTAPVPPVPPAATPPTPPPAPHKRSKWPYIGAGFGACLFLLIGMAMGSSPGSSIPEAINQPVVTATPVADPGGLDPDEPSVAEFDEKFTWASGVALTVKSPQPYKPAQYAIGATGAREILVETTIFNGSDTNFEFNSAIMGPTATHNGETASKVIDSQNGVGVTPVTTIRPGKAFTFKAAFSIGAEPGELQLAYRENFMGSPALFVGTI